MSLESPIQAQQEIPEVTIREMMRGSCKVTVTERAPSQAEDKKHPLFQEFYTDKKKIIEIILSNPEGVSLNLQDLLPEGWRFVQRETSPWRSSIGSEMHANFRDKVIVFPLFRFTPRIFARPLDLRGLSPESKVIDRPALEKTLFETHEFLKMKGSLLALLHEIGHLKQDEVTRQQSIYRSAEVKTKKGILEWKREQIIGYLENVMAVERDAWAEALELYRDFYAKGIDVEPDMTQEDIFQHITMSLHAYTQTSNPAVFEEAERIRRTNRIEKTAEENVTT